MRHSTPAPNAENIPAVDLVDSEYLRKAGRTPSVPFAIRRDDGGTVCVTRILRNLPGKRIAADAHANGERVLAKLFIGAASARHWSRESAGIRALLDAGMPTPQLIAAEALADGGHLIMSTFLGDAVSVASLWQQVADKPDGTPAAIEILSPVFQLLGQLHHAGLTHEDLHLGNFLRSESRLFIVDGDAVVSHPRAPIAPPEAMRNLGMLVAQLPMEWDLKLDPLLGAYRTGNPGAKLSRSGLEDAIGNARAARLADYMSKVRRDCSLFRVEQDRRRMSVIMRDQAEALAPLLADPDAWIASGTLLKDGRTATVATVVIDGRTLVVKRYNIKGHAHALSRALRPSRAWHAWVEGHRLRLLGIPTPTPLAVIESRNGPLRGRAWLITEHCSGESLRRHYDGTETQPPTVAEGDAICTLFQTLQRARISHGDLKSHNLFWHDGRLSLIDLDAMVQHRSQSAYARAWRKDRARLLRNWPQDSALVAWLDANLPPAP